MDGKDMAKAFPFFLGLFGLGGILVRYGIDRLVAHHGWEAPAGTLGINLAGSFLAGLFAATLLSRPSHHPELGRALVVGFCGGFTTFSALSLQGYHLLESGKPWTAMGYLLGSPLAGIACAGAGIALGRLWFAP